MTELPLAKPAAKKEVPDKETSKAIVTKTPKKSKKDLSFTGAGALMEKAQPGSKEEKEQRIIRVTAKALGISPFGVNILGDVPYINKLGLDTKAHQYEKGVRFLYDWVHIANDDAEKAICKCKLVDAKGKDLCDWVLGECSPATQKMGTLKGYQNHMAQTRAKNRAILETFGSQIHADLIEGIGRAIAEKETTVKEAAKIGQAASVSVEEVELEQRENRGYGIDPLVKAKRELLEYAVKKGAIKGQEAEFIENTLGRVIDWEHIDTKQIFSLKTELMSKTINNGSNA